MVDYTPNVKFEVSANLNIEIASQSDMLSIVDDDNQSFRNQSIELEMDVKKSFQSEQSSRPKFHLSLDKSLNQTKQALLKQ